MPKDQTVTWQRPDERLPDEQVRCLFITETGTLECGSWKMDRWNGSYFHAHSSDIRHLPSHVQWWCKLPGHPG